MRFIALARTHSSDERIIHHLETFRAPPMEQNHRTAEAQKGYLTEADRELLEHLCAKRPSQFIYTLDTASKQTWLESCGELLLRLHRRYSPQSSPRYALIERLLLEQYTDETVRGYSANVTETCEEELNLIVDVQVESATAADNAYLEEAVENSEAVLDAPAREISVDGAYYSEDNETYAREHDKDIHYAGFPGKKAITRARKS